MRRRGFLIAAIVTVLAVALLTRPAGDGPAGDGAQGQPDPGPVRIYSSLPIAAGDGLRDLDLAVRMAVAERAGRAGPHRIEHVALDSASAGLGIPWEAGQVQVNAARAAQDARSVAYVGDVFAGPSAISAPRLERAGILAVSPAAGGWAGVRSLVRVAPGEIRQAEALVRWMRRLGTRRLVVLEDGEVQGAAIARAMAREAGRRGIDLVHRATLDPRRLATLRRATERAVARRADTMLFTGVWQNRGAVTFNRFHRAVPRMRLMGTEGLADRSFTRELLAGARRRTRLITTEVPAPAAFARAFERRVGHRPHPLAVYGHEAADLVLDALAELPQAPPHRLRRALRNAVASAPRGGRARVGGLRVTPRGGLRYVGLR